MDSDPARDTVKGPDSRESVAWGLSFLLNQMSDNSGLSSYVLTRPTLMLHDARDNNAIASQSIKRGYEAEKTRRN